MRRRQALTAMPAAVGLAGCASPTTETSPTTLSRTAVRFAAAIRYGVANDHVGVEAPANDQFVLVSPPREATADGETETETETERPPPPSEFELVLDDRRYDPWVDGPGFTLATPGVGDVYTTDSRAGVLVFDVPTLDPSTVALVRDGTRYEVPESRYSRFGSAPAFDLESVDVPESAAVPDSESPGRVSMSVTVRNTGDRRGTFLAGVNRPGWYVGVEVLVGAEETESTSVSVRVWGDPGDANRLHVVYPGGSDAYTVTVAERE